MNPLPVLRGFREMMDAFLCDLEPVGYTDLAPNHFFERLRVFEHQWRHASYLMRRPSDVAISVKLQAQSADCSSRTPTWRRIQCALHRVHLPAAETERRPKHWPETYPAKRPRLRELEWPDLKPAAPRWVPQL